MSLFINKTIEDMYENDCNNVWLQLSEDWTGEAWENIPEIPMLGVFKPPFEDKNVHPFCGS